jgi:RNA polymerase sigma-70 factor (ECF subfamily)
MLNTYIKQFKKGNFNRFDAFYDATSKYVFFTLKKYIKDSMRIEDLMQDVYIKFIKKIDDLDVDKFNISYLTTMARNLAIDDLRKENNQVTYNDDLVHQYSDINQQEDYMYLLEKLQKEDKEIIYLHHIESLTFKEISILLNIPLQTIYSKYKGALKILKETYNESQKHI